jgi:dTMP kinase
VISINAPFITIEGIDGSGKTSVIEALKADLGTENILFTREPFEKGFRSEIHESIKNGYSPLSVLFLFLADRAEHIEKIIKPALQKGIPVISDRYMDSTIAYQGATLEDHFNDDKLSMLSQLHNGWALTPDLTILLNLSENEALERLSKRTDTYIEEFEKLDLLRSIRHNFLTLTCKEPDRFVIVNANQPPEKVLQDVKDILSKYLTIPKNKLIVCD